QPTRLRCAGTPVGRAPPRSLAVAHYWRLCETARIGDLRVGEAPSAKQDRCTPTRRVVAPSSSSFFLSSFPPLRTTFSRHGSRTKFRAPSAASAQRGSPAAGTSRPPSLLACATRHQSRTARGVLASQTLNEEKKKKKESKRYADEA
ncbi:hypothetical protein IscW_ISCW018595, partial [Ixodes scapularis]